MNELIYIQINNDDSYTRINFGGPAEIGGDFALGTEPSSGTTDIEGALRFRNVNLGQGVSVASATLKIYNERSQSGRVYYDCFGIKEVNTGAFSSSPFGRTTTTAHVKSNDAIPSSGNYLNIDVTNIVNEILAQGGWSSGNSLGFLLFEDSNQSTEYMEDPGERCMLVIKLTSDPDVTPDPVSISAPTFPSTSSYGIRVSQPGVDVKTATESELYFTTRKKQLRVNEELILENDTPIAHELGYAPFCLGFYEDASNNVRIMNFPFNAASVEPWVACDATNIYAGVIPGHDAYIYVFIDPLS